MLFVTNSVCQPSFYSAKANKILFKLHFQMHVKHMIASELHHDLLVFIKKNGTTEKVPIIKKSG